jgi:hypothetical protein
MQKLRTCNILFRQGTDSAELIANLPAFLLLPLKMLDLSGRNLAIAPPAAYYRHR